jgi:acylphosphatase
MFAHGHAVSLGLKGWVRNLPTGQVEAVAAGPRERLAQFRSLLSRGPHGAEVTRVDEFDVDPPSDLPDPFRVTG